LAARLAYFQVQLAVEQVRLVADSLWVSDAQYRDIDRRRRAGASSRIDSLSAHQDVLLRRRQFRQAQADLAASLRELIALTGQGSGLDLSLPTDPKTARTPPPGTEAASAAVSLEGLGSSLAALSGAETAGIDPSHPRLKSYEEQAESSRLNAESLGAGGWPKIQFSARSSYDYPNGPVLEYTRQNAVGLTASLPLFEGKLSAKQAEEARGLADASSHLRDQAWEEMSRDWLKSKDRVAALKAQREIDRQSVLETAELARLEYEAYQAGRATILEVQSANLRALEAKVQDARTQAELLIELAILENLSGQG
jgi:outer membrane protein TolC